MKHRIDKEGLINHYYRIRDYGFSHPKESETELLNYKSFIHKNKDPLSGKDYTYLFFFLYDGKDPIIDKSMVCFVDILFRIKKTNNALTIISILLFTKILNHFDY